MDTLVADPLHGALLGGRYRIMGRLARGSLATVYQARDERLDRPVAVKIIHAERSGDPRLLARLTDEATTVARLSHPNVVAVYDQGTHGDSPYIVMEFVRGRSLRSVLKERHRLDPVEALALLEQVLAALATAHRERMVHRDVKPENILVCPAPNGSGDLIDAVVKVADFGLAHVVEPTGRGGDRLYATPEYVAPELVADGRADPRSDVYSVGVVLFEMLTGRVPFEGQQPAEVAWRHVNQDVPPPSTLVPGAVPPVVDELVVHATRRDPASRPRDAGAMLAQVHAAREQVGTITEAVRALNQPTIVVPPIWARRADRPAWARLPTQRGSITARLGERFYDIYDRVPTWKAREAWDSTRQRIDQMRGSPRGRAQLGAALVALGVLVVSLGFWALFGRYTQAPGLMTLTKDQAVAEAGRYGLHIDFGPGRYAETIPVDTVLDQQPQPGGRILKGGTLTLFLSLGPERYAVPDVAGQASDFASAQLKEHFVVETTNGFSDTLPVGYVVGTDPVAGTLLRPDSVVKLIIAKGPFPMHVPTVVGLQLAEAQNQLGSLGFEVEVQRKDDDQHPRDQVLSQTPAGGTGVTTAKGVKVVIVVANGPAGAAMPNVVDAGCQAAKGQLEALGLRVDVRGNGIAEQFGHVTSQQPEPGAFVEPNQQVRIRCEWP